MALLAPPIQRRVQDRFFGWVHGNHLVYNCSWEDPRIDRELLRLDRSSRVVMITGGGCNALDYLLDEPAEVHSVDLNFRQNALLELKMQMLKSGATKDLFAFFGDGHHADYARIYRQHRGGLSASAATWWDQAAGMFSPAGRGGSFYYRGSAGLAAWIAMRVLIGHSREKTTLIQQLLSSSDLAEQASCFDQLDSVLWTPLSRWLLGQPALMTLLGVPHSQCSLMKEQGGLFTYIHRSLRAVLRDMSLRDNYFWRVYLTGSYTQECSPSYLNIENGHHIATRLGNLHWHSMSLIDFLRRNPGKYTHFVLLDHQDWLASHQPETLQREWELILQHAAPGAKVLMRSASSTVGFIPAFARECLQFYPHLTEAAHRKDRVGTYASTHLATLC